MTGDTDRDGGPTPAEARRLLPELTGAMFADELLGRMLARLAVTWDEPRSLSSLGIRWLRVANRTCPSVTAAHTREDGRQWNAVMLAAGIRECMAVLSGGDAA